MSALTRSLDHWLGVPAVALLAHLEPVVSRKSVRKPGPERILVIKLAAMGDTVLLVPVLRALRNALPAAKIDWLVSSTNEALASTVPYVDRLITLQSFAPGPVLRLANRLRSHEYDTVIDFEQWAKGTAVLAFLSGAPVRIGFDSPGQGRGRLFTSTLPKKYDQHELEDFFALLGRLIPANRDRRLELWETDAGRRNFAEAAPALQKPVAFRVLLHPGCGEGGLPREWPAENYVQLGRWLQETRGAQIVISGGPDDRETAERVAAGLPQGTLLAGKLSWQGTVSLLKTVDLVISGNTGIMHIAAALQKPQIALNGPTNPRFWGPLNPQAIVIQSSCPNCPCLRLGFEYHAFDQSCMERISVGEVKQAIQPVR